MYNFGEDYIYRLRNNKNQLYKDLKPKERICKIINEHIKPNIKNNEFKFVRSRMQLERIVGNFKQVVWFRTSLNNYKDDVVNFEVHLRVENNDYVKHCIDYYDFQKEYFITTPIEYLDLWNQESFGSWYRLQLDDNRKIAENIANNISYCTTNYLDVNSDFIRSLNYKFERFMSSDFFAPLLIPDILILSKMTNSLDIKEKTLKSFEDWKLTEEGQKDIEEGADIFDTIEKIKKLL